MNLKLSYILYIHKQYCDYDHHKIHSNMILCIIFKMVLLLTLFHSWIQWKYHYWLMLWHGDFFCVTGSMWGNPSQTDGFPSHSGWTFLLLLDWKGCRTESSSTDNLKRINSHVTLLQGVQWLLRTSSCLSGRWGKYLSFEYFIFVH